MKVGIMQPYFLPYIGYFQLINAVDQFVIYDDVQFIKGGWINRNNILLNDQKFMFNLLLSGASANKMINEIDVQPKQEKLLRTIEMSYKKAPYFDTVFNLICQILKYDDLNLAHYIGNSITEISKYLGLNTKITYSSQLDKNNSLKGQDKVIQICNLLNATSYVNAIGGQELYKKDIFKRDNIELFFVKTNSSEYKQFNLDFIPGLSILDVMMFNSVEEVNLMLDNFELL